MRKLATFALLASVLTLVVPDAPASAVPAVIHDVQVGAVAAGAPTSITAQVSADVGAPVTLDVKVGFDATDLAVAMQDQGGGTFTAEIPAQPAGTLVRWKVRAGAGADERTFPAKDGKRVYAGFVVERPAVDTQLPVFDWYISQADIEWLDDNRASKDYVPAVVVLGGEVIDGAEVRNQGGATAQTSPKPNYKFKLPGSAVAGPPYFEDPVDEFVVDADHEDPTFSIGGIGYRMYASTGSSPARQATTARVERNGSFFGVYQLYEELDGLWYDRSPYPIESLYEGESGQAMLVDEGSIEALAARWSEEEGDGTYADLAALAEAVDPSAGPARVDALVDRFDLPRLVDVLAMSALVQNWDAQDQNFDLARGPDDRWRLIPNDIDLTLGLRGRTRLGALVPVPLLDTTVALQGDGEIAQMVARRGRTLFDEWMADDRIPDEAAARVAAMEDDIALDRAAWNLAAVGIPGPEEGLEDLRDFVASQRAVAADWTTKGLVPPSQDPDATAQIGEVRANGDDGDLVELVNPDPANAVDISGWSLTGDTTVTLPAGTVIAAGGQIVVPASPQQVAAQHAGVPVAGQLPGPLGGGAIVLRDQDGAERHHSAMAATEVGLTVAVDAGRTATPLATPTPLRVVVHNRSATAHTDVVLDGPGTACDRDLGPIAAGAQRVLWCDAPGGPQTEVQALRTTVRSAQQPVAHVSSPVLLRTAGTPLIPSPPVPTLHEVRLADDGLLAQVTAPGFPGTPTREGVWRLETQLAPEPGGEVDARVVAPASQLAVDAPDGVPARLRISSRSVSSISSVSVWSPVVTPRGSETWPYPDAAALVDGWYRSLAGRAPTSDEAALWSAALAGDAEPVDVAMFLLGWDRWAKQVAPLVRLYLADFGRVPDSGGLRYWVGRRRAGVSLQRISRQFAGSGEFERRFDADDSLALVTGVYRNVFGREPDAGGRDYWVRRVEAGLSAGDLVLAFSESSEGVRRLAHTVDPVVAWFAFHDRAPGPAWLDPARQWLDAGGEVATVVEAARSAVDDA